MPTIHCGEAAGKPGGDVSFAAGSCSAHSANRYLLTDRLSLGKLGTGLWPGSKEWSLFACLLFPLLPVADSFVRTDKEKQHHMHSKLSGFFSNWRICIV